MPALKGNQFWKARASHGREAIFSDPEKMWEAAQEYFEWVEANPLKEQKVFNGKDGIVYADVSKMRAMTIDGLCLFMDIGTQTWRDYKSKEDFSGVTARIEKVIRDQKFSGASADLLNANIIARDLGLADKQQLDVNLSHEQALDELDG